MPFCKISPDVKFAAIRIYERGLLPLVDCLDFSESTFYGVLKLWGDTGDVVRRRHLTVSNTSAKSTV